MQEETSKVDQVLSYVVAAFCLVHGVAISMAIYTHTVRPVGLPLLVYWAWLLWAPAFVFIGARPALVPVTCMVIGSVSWAIWAPAMLFSLAFALGART
jgi:hypothetical protein